MDNIIEFNNQDIDLSQVVHVGPINGYHQWYITFNGGAEIVQEEYQMEPHWASRTDFVRLWKAYKDGKLETQMETDEILYWCGNCNYPLGYQNQQCPQCGHEAPYAIGK